MKRFIVTILAIFYLGVSSGATLYFHYCMGKLVETSLTSKEFKACNNCGMKAGSGKDCCKHENKQVKVDSAQKLADHSYHFKAFSTDLLRNTYSLNREIYGSSFDVEQPLSNSPPGTDNTPAFILNCNFRI